MSTKTVKMVSPDGAVADVVESAFRNVWEERGYRLLADVEAERAKAADDAEITPADPEPAEQGSSTETATTGAKVATGLRRGETPE